MAYEIKPWKHEGCVLTFVTSKLSDRPTFSEEINKEYGEGGGLNANYQTVDAIANLVSFLADRGDFRYGEDFVFKTAGVDRISFDFASPEIKKRIQIAMEDFLAD